MASIKNINIISIAILILASVILCLPLQLYAEDVQGSYSFMDMKSSVDLLLSEVKKARKSIVNIVAYDSAGVVKSGSGVFIDTEGRIITNASILKNAYSAEVFSETTHYKDVTMLKRNESIDIALLQVNANNEIPLELDYKFKIAPGERVVVIGKSSDFSTTVSEGLISDVINIREASDFFEIETARGLLTYKNSEDGSVINMEGKVIGISVKIMPDYRDEIFRRSYSGENLNAISAGSIRIMVEGPYEIEHFYPPGTKVWTQWFQRELKDNTVSTFLALYDMGFNKILKIAFICIVLIALIQWLWSKLKKRMSGK